MSLKRRGEFNSDDHYIYYRVEFSNMCHHLTGPRAMQIWGGQWQMEDRRGRICFPQHARNFWTFSRGCSLEGLLRLGSLCGFEGGP